MNESSTNRLYQLLPAIYQERDLEREELKSLLAIIEHELDILETDIGDLYENWFIETADDWVVPYIGDLLGISGISARAPQGLKSQGYGQQESRAYVANTLAYRRRKGTPPVLEQLARDVTGWRARGVEFFDHLAISQNLNHLRLGNTTVDLKEPNSLQLLGSPFEQQVAYSTELGHIATGQGKYNVHNIGLFLWRLQSYPITRGTATLVSPSEMALRQRIYTFSPLSPETLNRPIPLFNPPQPETEITQLAAEVNVPGPLRTDPTFAGYRGKPPAFQIFINGQTQPIPPEEILITRIESAEHQNRPLLLPQLQPPKTELLQATKVVAVDPESGQFAWLDRTPPSQVEVTYAYGFSEDMGGGPYDRSDTMTQIPAETLPQPADLYFSPLYWEVEQTRSSSPHPLTDAVQAWNGTVQAWQAFYNLSFIPLARLEIPKVRIAQQPLEPGERPRCQFGILSGLTPILTPGIKQIVITPGSAIDDRGRSILVDCNTVLEMDEISPRLPVNQPLWVVVAYWADRIKLHYQLSVIPHSQAEQYPNGTYLRLVSFSLDGDRKIKASTQPIQQPYRAGIVGEGLNVITSSDALEAIVTPGIAVDELGRAITLDRKISLDLRDYQNQTVWLAIAYAESPSNTPWQIFILPNKDAQDQKRFPTDRYIRLAKLLVPPVRLTKLSTQTSPTTPVTLYPNFVEGIVEGLTVEAETGDRTVTVTAGRALDPQGQEIVLKQDYRVRGLGRYRDETVTLAIAYRQNSIGPNWEVKLLRASDAPNPKEPYLNLASLQIGELGRVVAKPTNLLPKFKPGVVEGTLQVTYASAGSIRVSQGTAVDQLGRAITLADSCEVELSQSLGRALILFIAHPTKRGWKALAEEDIETGDTGQSWQHLGIVPEPPAKDPQLADQPPKTGVIAIRDNHTYVGDLEILLPTSKDLQLKFQLLAANGYRPHLKGDIAIRGIVDSGCHRSSDFEPGTCRLDGLLIEGAVTVLPGDLKHLVMSHCTLVPQVFGGGLRVEANTALQAMGTHSPDENDAPPYLEADNETEGFLFLLVSMFFLIGQLLKLGFGNRHLSSRQRLEQLTQYMMAELENVWCAFQEEFYQSRRSDALNDLDNADANGLNHWLRCEPEQEAFSGNNADLEITIDRSIVGPIYLADSVAQVAILDSIIDQGTAALTEEQPEVAGAIVASGAAINSQRSTLFGTVNVRRLEASLSLFTDVVSVLDRQQGCLRFCYVPVGSQTPLRYRCQPDLALQTLPCLPAGITAFMTDPSDRWPLLGTAGQGVLRLSEPQTSVTDNNWGKTSLDSHFITALSCYYQSDGQLVILAGATGGEMFCLDQKQLEKNKPVWQLTESPPTKADITAFLTYIQPLGEVDSQGATATADDNTNTISILLAGTAGNGVWQFDQDNKTWHCIPLGQGDLDARRSVTSLACDTNHTIFVGTYLGVWALHWSYQHQCWKTVMQSLASRQITALEIDTHDRIFAGTADGGVFRSLDGGRHWNCMSQGLAHSKITALTIQRITGQGQVNDNTLVVSADIARQLRCGSAITINNQTRIINQIIISEPNESNGSAQPQTLVLDANFCLGLSGEVTFNSHYLFVGTARKGIFRSQDNGEHWEVVTPNLTHQHITVLAVDAAQSRIWAGTALGSMFCSDDHGEQWHTANQGLTNVEEVLPILLRMQPRFTTTDYGAPAYAQLSQHCPPEIRQGAEDGSEMGAFNQLKQPQRESNLLALLDEYLRFGLKAGMFYMT